MEKIKVSSIPELKDVLSGFNDGYLFRGQSRHYTDGSSTPSLTPSFFSSRERCVPPTRHRWSTHADFIIHTILGHSNFDEQLSEAILQHYGWKSFFLDLSASSHVAAWFASHSFSEKVSWHMSEDCYETAVQLHNLKASYEL